MRWEDNTGGQNQLWAGSPTAGLRVKLKGDEFDWESPLHMQTAAPKSWGGDAGGGDGEGGILHRGWRGGGDDVGRLRALA